jgi:hypothetical protein
MTHLPSTVMAGRWRLVVLLCLSAIFSGVLIAGTPTAATGRAKLEGGGAGSAGVRPPSTDLPTASTPDDSEPGQGDGDPPASPDSSGPADAGSGGDGFTAGTDERQFQGAGVGVSGAPVRAPAAPAVPVAPTVGESLAGTGAEPLLVGLTGLGMLLLGAGLRIGRFRCVAMIELMSRSLRPSPRSAWLLALASAMAVLLLSSCGGSEVKKPPKGKLTSTAASVSQLKAAAKASGHAVYWAGPKTGFTYELSQIDGRIYIRYLPAGVQVGDPRPGFLTVGTYPQNAPFQTVRAAAKKRHGVTHKIAGGGLAVAYKPRLTSVYLVFPGKNLLVETYDPSPKKASQLVTSGQIAPIS